VTTSPVTWRSRTFPQRHRLVGPTVGRSPSECCGGVERIEEGDRARAFFSQAASYLSVEGGGMQGKVELAEALDTTGVV
jgi:hypothetical protein